MSRTSHIDDPEESETPTEDPVESGSNGHGDLAAADETGEPGDAAAGAQTEEHPGAAEQAPEAAQGPAEAEAHVEESAASDDNPQTELEGILDGGESADSPEGSGEHGELDAEQAEGEAAQPEGPRLGKTRPENLTETHLKSVIESLVFVSDKPVTAKQLAKTARAKPAEVHRLLEELAEEYRGRGFQLNEVAGGWQFRTAAVNAPFVRDMVSQKPVRLTRAQLEALAIVAYRQPVTRPEVEEIRGVDSGSAVKVLADRGLIKTIGRKDEPGRPLLYGTTPAFLEFFGLSSLKDLPTLQEFSELSEESRALFERKMGEPIDLSQVKAPEARSYEDEDDEPGEADTQQAQAEGTEASTPEDSQPAEAEADGSDDEANDGLVEDDEAAGHEFPRGASQEDSQGGWDDDGAAYDDDEPQSAADEAGEFAAAAAEDEQDVDDDLDDEDEDDLDEEDDGDDREEE
jgi:segregation and condensation protein B